jgi:hypothetical protein
VVFCSSLISYTIVLLATSKMIFQFGHKKGRLGPTHMHLGVKYNDLFCNSNLYLGVPSAVVAISRFLCMLKSIAASWLRSL